MKYFFSIVFFAGVFFFYSCSPSLSNAIIGNWYIEDAYIDDLDEKFQEFKNLDTSNINIDDFEAIILNYLHEFELEFNQNNSCILNSDTGSWQGEENIILINTSQNSELIIKQISKNDIIATYNFKFYDINIEAEISLTRKLKEL